MKKKYVKYFDGGYENILALHDKYLSELVSTPSHEVYVDTRFGKTCVTVSGNPEGRPLMLIGGHRMTNASFVCSTPYLHMDYCIYSPSIIGQAGRSENGSIDPKNYGFGWWASDVIKGLGLDKPIIMACSYGGGVLANLLCCNPDICGPAVMLVPSCLLDFNMYKVTKAGLRYKRLVKNRDEEGLRADAAISNGAQPEPIRSMAINLSVTISLNCVVPDIIPQTVNPKDLPDGKIPAFVSIGEVDHLYPCEKMLAYFKKHYPSAELYLNKGYGHTSYLPPDGRDKLLDFLRRH